MKHFDGDLFINEIIPQLQILYVQPIEGGGMESFCQFQHFLKEPK